MELTDEIRRTLRCMLALVDRLPNGAWMGFSTGRPGLLLQAATREDANSLCSVFPEVVWRWEYSEQHKWWECTTEIEGVEICIYAIREGPASDMAGEVT